MDAEPLDLDPIKADLHRTDPHGNDREALIAEVERLRRVAAALLMGAGARCATCGRPLDRRVFCNRTCQLETVQRERREERG